MFKILLFACVSAVWAAERPQLFCDHSAKPGDCHLLNVYLHRDQPRYKINSALKHDDVETVTMYDQKLAVLSRDICDAFPRMWSLYAASNKIEIVDQDAFTACFTITTLDISDNQIQVLPPDAFKNNFKLSFLNLQMNRIGMISDDQFENNLSLEYIYLGINNLEGFPAIAVRNCENLKALLVYSNNLFEVDAAGILENCPQLREAMVNGNLMPCSRVNEMLQVFRDVNVSLSLDYLPRPRPFRMGEVGRHSCVDAQ